MKLRTLAFFAVLALAYIDAARSDDAAQQQVLTAMASAAWHP
jgi:hypothetical protein